MANLSITGATQGYNITGVASYIKNLELQIVDQTIQLLYTEEAKVVETVNQVWQGKSAETYKGNMHHDILIIAGALRQATETLKGTINHTVNNMVRLDETLVKDRGGNN